MVVLVAVIGIPSVLRGENLFRQETEPTSATETVFLDSLPSIPSLPMEEPVPTPAPRTLPDVAAASGMRGVWITSAYNLDWPSRQGLTPAQLRAEIDAELALAVSLGMNAVFVQVRPSGDVLYRSEIFPWSHLLTGEQGRAPAENFDPLEYWIERGHALGVEVHAWLNPYRVTFPVQRITDPNLLVSNHPARLNPSLVIAYNNALFFDPGNPDARQLVVDSVAELLRNYNLDGIHLDDYFYPSRSFPDEATFARYGSGMNLYDWRRENVNALIRDLQSIVREISPNVSFGVSPFAIWKNVGSDPRGSNTRGNESYHAMFADTRRWVLEGWVDYIVPQIYWYEGHSHACYEAVITWWEDLVRGTNVRLYIGHSVYREVRNWDNWDGELIRQLERNSRSDVVSGSIFFRSEFMNSTVGREIAAFYARHGLLEYVPTMINTSVTTPATATNVDRNAPSIIMDTLIVAQPGANRTVTDFANFFMYGSAVPGVPVYVNGQLITNRTDEGFWSVFLPLQRGQNTFTFTQAGQPTITRIITNNATPIRHPVTMQVGITNAFPMTDEWARVGTTLTLRATAPAGATVTAEIAGQTIQMRQSNPNLTATANNIVAAQFVGEFTLNVDAAPDTIIDIGRPVYTMTWNNQTRTVTAAANIRQLGMEAPFFARVIVDAAWVFPIPGATVDPPAGGSHWMLFQNQMDRVTAISGQWTRLASGWWISNAHVYSWLDSSLTSPVVPSMREDVGFLSEGRYVVGTLEDVIVWDAPFFPAVMAEFDGSELIVSLGMQNVAPPIFQPPSGSLFSDIRIGVHNGAPSYFMTLNEGARFEGFYTEFVDNQLRLVLRRRRPLAQGNYPFAGFTFVLDPGHGGTDPGAIGAMGSQMSEAHIVLRQGRLIAERLESLGANVILTRNSDVFITLQQRVMISRANLPDMFISLHTDATAETTDATNIRGFTVWYRNPISLPAAETFVRNMYNVNPNTNRSHHARQANFWVCRPVWSPTILLEASFTNNINDFSWLINEHAQQDYAWAFANTLLAYFR